MTAAALGGGARGGEDGGMYSEWRLAGGGGTVWVRQDGGGRYRVVPDGCMDVIWHDGALLVAGPDTVAHVSEDPAGSSYVGVRFDPGVGPLVLGAPACEVRDRRVPLDALWPAAPAGRLARRADADPAAVLAAWAVRRLGSAGSAGALPGAVAAALGRGRPVAEVAARAGLGERQLRRRCEAAFGYGPKTLARVLRFQRALALARAGTGFAEAAVLAGYADQPHLAREVKALSGVPLSALVGPADAEEDTPGRR